VWSLPDRAMLCDRHRWGAARCRRFSRPVFSRPAPAHFRGREGVLISNGSTEPSATPKRFAAADHSNAGRRRFAKRSGSSMQFETSLSLSRARVLSWRGRGVFHFERFAAAMSVPGAFPRRRSSSAGRRSGGSAIGGTRAPRQGRRTHRTSWRIEEGHVTTMSDASSRKLPLQNFPNAVRGQLPDGRPSRNYSESVTSTSRRFPST
jgi:hypothetical protein